MLSSVSLFGRTVQTVFPWLLAAVLLSGCGPGRNAAWDPPESPWPELMALDLVAAQVEQRILSGVGRTELAELSGELALALEAFLDSSPPDSIPEPVRVQLLTEELTRGHQLVTGEQSMNPDLLMRFHGLTAALFQAAGMGDLHAH